uniref:Uncharacterized protein n=1 Tax=Anguilla anguilla TaxID=7936 RepID=A0A0E9QK75_ANGAN
MLSLMVLYSQNMMKSYYTNYRVFLPLFCWCQLF